MLDRKRTFFIRAPLSKQNIYVNSAMMFHNKADFQTHKFCSLTGNLKSPRFLFLKKKEIRINLDCRAKNQADYNAGFRYHHKNYAKYPF